MTTYLDTLFETRTELNFAGDNSVVIPYYIDNTGTHNYVMHYTSKTIRIKGNNFSMRNMLTNKIRPIREIVTDVLGKTDPGMFVSNIIVRIETIIKGKEIVEGNHQDNYNLCFDIFSNPTIYNIGYLKSVTGNNSDDIKKHIHVVENKNEPEKFLILIRKNELSFIKGNRLEKKNAGRFVYTETPRECAAREFAEETGYNLTDLKRLDLKHVYVNQFGSATFFYELAIDRNELFAIFGKYRANEQKSEIMDLITVDKQPVNIINAMTVYFDNCVSSICNNISNCDLEKTSENYNETNMADDEWKAYLLERIRVYSYGNASYPGGGAGGAPTGLNFSCNMTPPHDSLVSSAQHIISTPSSQELSKSGSLPANAGAGRSPSPPTPSLQILSQPKSIPKWKASPANAGAGREPDKWADLGAFRKLPSGGSSQQKMLKYINKIKMLTN